MATCDRCNEYEIAKDATVSPKPQDRHYCVPCQFQMKCEDYLREAAFLVLQATKARVSTLRKASICARSYLEFARAAIAQSVSRNYEPHLVRIAQDSWYNMCLSLRCCFSSSHSLAMSNDDVAMAGDLLRICFTDVLSPCRKMVSVSFIRSSWDVAGYCHENGFSEAPAILPNLEAETAGGYAAYLLGDPGASSEFASVFGPVQRDIKSLFVKGTLSIALGSDNLVHLCGADADLPDHAGYLLLSSRGYSLGSAIGDMMEAMYWWTDIRKLRLKWKYS